MPIDIWPCRPESFDEVVDRGMAAFLQSGATLAVGRGVAIIDPIRKERFDPLDRWHGFTPFCRSLRDPRSAGLHDLQGGDRACSCFDVAVAEVLCAQSAGPDGIGDLHRYRCYMGLEELALVMTVGGYRVMVVCGQFLPADGPNDILQAIARLKLGRIGQTEIPAEFAPTLGRDWLRGELRKIRCGEVAGQWLAESVQDLQPMAESDTVSFQRICERLYQVCHTLYDTRKASVESRISKRLQEEVALSVTGAPGSGLSCLGEFGADPFWRLCQSALGILVESFGLRYAAFFSGEDERDNLLRIRGAVGLSLEPGSVHLNWRKAGLRVGSDDADDDGLDWRSVSWFGANARPIADRALRGPGKSKLDDLAVLVPVAIPSHVKGMVVLGPPRSDMDFHAHSDFVRSLCVSFGSTLLTAQLGYLMSSRTEEWERTSKLTGHRVRAGLQSLESNLSVIRACVDHEPGFGHAEEDEAKTQLDRAVRQLREVSQWAELRIPGAVDVRSSQRALVSLSSIVDEAVDDQLEGAREQGVTLQVSDAIRALPPVRVHEGLIRLALINIINNAIKYSRQPRAGKERTVRIAPPHEWMSLPPGKVRLEIVNFGLGIEQENLESVFEWGRRLVEGPKLASRFRERYGQGLGLWEARSIVQGHGGEVLVSSTHHSGSPVTKANINECITVFTVVLPIPG